MASGHDTRKRDREPGWGDLGGRGANRSRNWRNGGFTPISRRVELTPYRPLDVTPWRRSAHTAAQRALRGQTVETVTMTRVEVTRARAFDGRGFGADWTFDDRPLPSTEVSAPSTARAEHKEVEAVEATRREAGSGFEHAPMTPLPTEGFLSLWERRHRGDHTGPAPRRAAAAFLAHERAPLGS